MHYFLYVRLEGFYAKSLLSVQPELKSLPLVIHRDKRVLDSSAEAGPLRTGMPLGEAKAILRDARFVRWEEEPYRDAQVEWLELMTEFSDVVEPRAQHEAFLDLSLHPDPIAIALDIRAALHSRLGHRAEIGIGSTKWIAELSSRRALSGSLIQEEIDLADAVRDPAGFLESLTVDALLPVPPEARERLKFLGYHSIGSVATLPLSLLREQFNGHALLIYQASKGAVFQPVEPRYPESSLLERIVFDGPVEDLVLLDRALLELSQKLAGKLETGDLEGNTLRAAVVFEERAPVSVEREFTKPMHTERSVFAGLRLLLEPVFQPSDSESGSGGVLAIRIMMPSLRKVKAFQTDLSSNRSGSERAASSAAAFQHIRKVFGDHAIEVASDKAEPRRKVVLRAWREATGWH